MSENERERGKEGCVVETKRKGGRERRYCSDREEREGGEDEHVGERRGKEDRQEEQYNDRGEMRRWRKEEKLRKDVMQ